MADNVAITAGSGTTIASDDIGGVQFQRVKIGVGADGSAADLAFGAAASAASLPVVLASDQGWVGATNLGKAEDAAHASGDVGVQMLAVRTDSPANRSGADGDYEPLQVSGGLLWTRSRGMLTPNGDSMIDDTLDALKVVSSPGASELHIGQIGGTGGAGNASYTRPADTAPYAANDTVSDSTSAPNVLTFTGMGRVNAGTGYVVKARLTTSQTSNTARHRLHLFRAAPTAINDNAGCSAPLATNLANWIGYIDFPAMQTGAGSPDRAFSVADGLRLHFACDAAATSLFGLLMTLDAYTPANAQTYQIYLSTEQD